MFKREAVGEYITDWDIGLCYDAVKDVAKYKKMKLIDADKGERTLVFRTPITWTTWGGKMFVDLHETLEGKTRIRFRCNSNLGTEIQAGSVNERNVDELISLLDMLITGDRSVGSW